MKSLIFLLIVWCLFTTFLTPVFGNGYDESKEDAQAIEQILKLMMIKAEEKSHQKIMVRWPELQPRIEKVALKLTRTKAWILGINHEIITFYPEMLALEPILRVLRTTILYPTLIATGFAKLIPLIAVIPDIELLDVAYYKVRRWIDKKRFKYRYGHDFDDIEKLKADLLLRSEIPQKEIEAMIDNPAFLRYLLNHTFDKKDYLEALYFWKEGKWFSDAISSPLTPDIEMVVAVENLISRAEMETAFLEMEMSFREWSYKERREQWFSLFWRRREIYKKIHPLKDLQNQFLVFVLDQKPIPFNLQYRFKRHRDQLLAWLSANEQLVEKYQGQRLDLDLSWKGCLKALAGVGGNHWHRF